MMEQKKLNFESKVHEKKLNSCKKNFHTHLAITILFKISRGFIFFIYIENCEALFSFKLNEFNHFAFIF